MDDDTDRGPGSKLMVNPGAGALRSDPDLLDSLREHPALRGAELVAPESAEEMAAAVRAVVDDDDRSTTVVVGGGDGTLHLVVQELFRAMGGGEADRMPRLAVLPLGTANDFARSLGVADLDDALDALSGGGEFRPVDLLALRLDDGEPEVAVNHLVGGLAGRVQEEVTPEMKSRWGPLAYVRGGIEAIRDESYEAWIAIDGGPREAVRFLSVGFLNGRYAGGGIPVAPAASLEDGRLDLVLIDDVPVSAVAILAPLMLAGRHGDHDAVRVARATEVSLGADVPITFSVDGEEREAREVDVEVRESMIDVLVAGDGLDRALREDTGFEADRG